MLSCCGQLSSTAQAPLPAAHPLSSPVHFTTDPEDDISVLCFFSSKDSLISNLLRLIQTMRPPAKPSTSKGKQGSQLSWASKGLEGDYPVNCTLPSPVAKQGNGLVRFWDIQMRTDMPLPSVMATELVEAFSPWIQRIKLFLVILWLLCSKMLYVF